MAGRPSTGSGRFRLWFLHPPVSCLGPGLDRALLPGTCAGLPPRPLPRHERRGQRPAPAGPPAVGVVQLQQVQLHPDRRQHGIDHLRAGQRADHGVGEYRNQAGHDRSAHAHHPIHTFGGRHGGRLPVRRTASGPTVDTRRDRRSSANWVGPATPSPASTPATSWSGACRPGGSRARCTNCEVPTGRPSLPRTMSFPIRTSPASSSDCRCPENTNCS